MGKVIRLETLRQGIKSLEKFSEIFSHITCGFYKDIEIDLTGYKYIHPSYAVLLASMPYVGNKFRCLTRIRCDDGNVKSQAFLKQSGIIQHYQESWLECFNDRNVNSIKFSKLDDVDDASDIVSGILDIAPVMLSNDVRNELHSRLYEIFDNAFTHSDTTLGVFCCGFLLRNKLCFSIYDPGIGIYRNVKNYLDKDISHKEALEWAFEKGNSTLNDKSDFTRGAGLGLLEDFITLNAGNIYVVSQKAFCVMGAKSTGAKHKRFYELKNSILGTLFTITINPDRNNVYVLKNRGA